MAGEAVEKLPLGPPQLRMRLACAVSAGLSAAGAAAFLLAVTGPDPKRAWQAYLTNFLFWTGLSLGSVMFLGAMNLARARWARSMKRLAEALGAFLPVSFFLFWALYPGKDHIFPWIDHPVEEKAFWLNETGLFIRDGVGLLIIVSVSMVIIIASLRGDRRASAELREAAHGSSMALEEVKRFAFEREPLEWRIQAVLSPILGILYAVVLSLLSIDLVMSLDPHWYSTLFGAYFFVGSFYMAIAALMVLAVLARGPMGLHSFIRPRQFHDLGKLLLGFCLLTGDFFYSQFLVIWYGNMPEDASYVILRVKHPSWDTISWVVLIACFVVPFVVLLARRVKLIPGIMMALGCVILAGMWLERLLLVAPSLWKGETLPIGHLEVLVTLGFLGTFALCVMFFLRSSPVLPLSDPIFRQALAAEKPTYAGKGAR